MSNCIPDSDLLLFVKTHDTAIHDVVAKDTDHEHNDAFEERHAGKPVDIPGCRSYDPGDQEPRNETECNPREVEESVVRLRL